MTSQTEDKNTAADEAKASDQASQEAGKELIDELTRLGQKFVEVVEVAWNSEQRKKIEEDLRTGLVSVANTLEDGFKRVSSTKEAKEAVNAAEDVAAKVRSSKVAIELTEALSQGLRTLSEKMDELSEEMRQKGNPSKSAGTSSSSSETQDIPIAREDEK
jgi:hypothetical protein